MVTLYKLWEKSAVNHLKDAKLQLWWIPQVPMKAFEVDIATVEEGDKLLAVLADYDLFQFENNIKPDYCNTGGLRWQHPQMTNGWEDYPEEADERELLEEDFSFVEGQRLSHGGERHGKQG